MKIMIRKILKWIINPQIQELNQIIEKNKILSKSLENVLNNIDISIDVHDSQYYDKSWAVFSLQGGKTNYIKFINLGDKDIKYIAQFIRNFEKENLNIKVDASPNTSNLLKILN